MTIDRRQFLRGAVSGTAACGGALAATPAEAFSPRPNKPMPPKAVGILYDSTQCIGCRACVDACKEANGMPVEMPQQFDGWNEGTWDAAEDLSGQTLNVIKAYRHGTMAEKDRIENGYAFVKRHCLHCVDQSCVSVCPVSAMQKDPDTGIVTHDAEACIGCRYCVYGCLFGVPQYDLDNAFGEIQKCQFCVNLQAEGRIPACCDVCPTGASLFGLVEDLNKEAHRRVDSQPGTPPTYPRGQLGAGRPSHQAPAPKYLKAVYGETEGGGTQVQYVSAVPFEKLGLPALEKTSYAAISEGIQHTLYKGMIAPLVVLGGLLFFARRSAKEHPENED